MMTLLARRVVPQSDAGTIAVLIDEQDACTFQGCPDSDDALPIGNAPAGFEIADCADTHASRLCELGLRPVHQCAPRSDLSGGNGLTCHNGKLQRFALTIDEERLGWQHQRFALDSAGQSVGSAPPGLTMTAHSENRSMASRADTMAAHVRGSDFASVSHRPTYRHRVLAHLATGSLPPAPRWGDMATLSVPAVAAAVGWLAGVAL